MQQKKYLINWDIENNKGQISPFYRTHNENAVRQYRTKLKEGGS